MLMWDGSSTGGIQCALPSLGLLLAHLPALRLLPQDTLEVTQDMGAVPDLWDTPENFSSFPELLDIPGSV